MYLVSEVGNMGLKFQWEGKGHEAVVTYLTVNCYTMPQWVREYHQSVYSGWIYNLFPR
jgi:hypothetical protein